MNRNEYCDRVLAQVGRLTADEANDLRNELAGHIEDHAEALVEHGYTEEDAAAEREEAPVIEPKRKRDWGSIFQKTFDKINKSFTAAEDEEI